MRMIRGGVYIANWAVILSDTHILCIENLSISIKTVKHDKTQCYSGSLHRFFFVFFTRQRYRICTDDTRLSVVNGGSTYTLGKSFTNIKS